LVDYTREAGLVLSHVGAYLLGLGLGYLLRKEREEIEQRETKIKEKFGV
jgi:hypothetical protein